MHEMPYLNRLSAIQQKISGFSAASLDTCVFVTYSNIGDHQDAQYDRRCAQALTGRHCLQCPTRTELLLSIYPHLCY